MTLLLVAREAALEILLVARGMASALLPVTREAALEILLVARRVALVKATTAVDFTDECTVPP